MSILLVDIGNTRLKYTLAEAHGVFAVQALLHSAAGFTSLLAAQWQQIMQPPTRVVICCVSHVVLLQQIVILVQQLWPGISVSTPKAQAWALGVKSAYAQPESLGVDRWLASSG